MVKYTRSVYRAKVEYTFYDEENEQVQKAISEEYAPKDDALGKANYTKGGKVLKSKILECEKVTVCITFDELIETWKHSELNPKAVENLDS